VKAYSELIAGSYLCRAVRLMYMLTDSGTFSAEVVGRVEAVLTRTRSLWESEQGRESDESIAFYPKTQHF
jgi:hypothetical protein